MTDQATIEKAAQFANTAECVKLGPSRRLHAALQKADPNWDEGLSFDQAVDVLIAVERLAQRLQEEGV